MSESQTTVLCGANSYEEKYYFNEEFSALPQGIKDELQITCVVYVEEVGGVLTMEFEEDGTLTLNVQYDEKDYLFDEISAGLKIKQIQMEKQELFEGLETYFKARKMLKA